MGDFNKRRFQSIGEVLAAIEALSRRPRGLLELVAGRGPLDPDLREKIMLAVTSVNRCRYCSFVHTLIALKEGASLHEIRTLLAGVVDEVDEQERQALLFAQHWADTEGHPDPEARQRLIEAYGEEASEAIETAIRAIMFGNYFGNTLDALLHALSGGKLASEP